MRSAERKKPPILSYSKKHVWARIQGDAVLVGVTDYLQKRLGAVINVEFSENRFVEKGGPIA